jgi:hypothetical protein
MVEKKVKYTRRTGLEEILYFLDRPDHAFEGRFKYCQVFTQTHQLTELVSDYNFLFFSIGSTEMSSQGKN